MGLTISAAETMSEVFYLNKEESCDCITLIGFDTIEQFDKILKKLVTVNFSSACSLILKNCLFTGEAYVNALKKFIDALNEERIQKQVSPVFFILLIEEGELSFRLSDVDASRLFTINRLSVFNPERENPIPVKLKVEPWVGNVPEIDDEERMGQERLSRIHSFWTASEKPFYHTRCKGANHNASI